MKTETYWKVTYFEYIDKELTIEDTLYYKTEHIDSKFYTALWWDVFDKRWMELTTVFSMDDFNTYLYYRPDLPFEMVELNKKDFDAIIMLQELNK